MTFIKKLQKKYHPRIFELMSIHVDNYLEIKKKGLTKETLKEFIENVQDSGPVVIKLFQWISCNSAYLDLFLNNINNIDLSEVKIIQDGCKIQDIDKIIIRIKNELCDFDEDLFNRTPLGVGSIAQVHKYGKNIIKICHNDIEKIIKDDLEILSEIIKLGRDDYLENILDIDYFKIIHMLDIDMLIKELGDQTDLRIEKSNIEKMKETLKYDNIKLPDVIYASKEILIETFLEGENINNYKEDKDKIIQYKINTIIMLLHMVHNGVVHADLHDGNILYNDNGINLIDFGIIKTLTDIEKKNIKGLFNLLYISLNSLHKSDIDIASLAISYLCPEITEKDIKFLMQRMTISLKIKKGKKKYTIKDIPKVIDLLHTFLLKKNYLLNDNITYCALTTILIEGNISKKYNIKLINKVMDYIKDNGMDYLI